MKSNTLAIALASLLVGGVAVAAFQNRRTDLADIVATTAPLVRAPAPALAAGGVQGDGSARTTGRLDYAEIVKVAPITHMQKRYAQVIGTEPVRETSSVSTPHQECNDVVVQRQAPRRDPRNIGGTVAGAVIGGLIGNQVGGGTGKKLATVGGAVGGGFAGRAIEQYRAQNKMVSSTERQCRTVMSTAQSSRVVAYNVTYRNPDGTIGTLRTANKPGSRIARGSVHTTVAYNVTYRYNGQENTVRMDRKPTGVTLPVVDGQIVTQLAAAAVASSRQ